MSARTTFKPISHSARSASVASVAIERAFLASADGRYSYSSPSSAAAGSNGVALPRAASASARLSIWPPDVADSPSSSGRGLIGCGGS